MLKGTFSRIEIGGEKQKQQLGFLFLIDWIGVWRRSVYEFQRNY